MSAAELIRIKSLLPELRPNIVGVPVVAGLASPQGPESTQERYARGDGNVCKRYPERMTMRMERLGMLVLALILPLAALGGCESKTTDDSIEPITIDALRAEMADSRAPERLLLLDARSARDFGAGHLPTAKNYAWERIGDTPQNMDPRLDRFKVKVVYGNDRGSATARALTKRMIQAGYKNVRMYLGGLEEWTRAGLPVERSAEPAGANP